MDQKMCVEDEEGTLFEYSMVVENAVERVQRYNDYEAIVALLESEEILSTEAEPRQVLKAFPDYDLKLMRRAVSENNEAVQIIVGELRREPRKGSSNEQRNIKNNDLGYMGWLFHGTELPASANGNEASACTAVARLVEGVKPRTVRKYMEDTKSDDLANMLVELGKDLGWDEVTYIIKSGRDFKSLARKNHFEKYSPAEPRMMDKLTRSKSNNNKNK